MIEISNCKLNLGLKIIGKKENGYHELKSLMIPLDFYDVLTFEGSDQDIVVGNDKVKMEDDLIYKTIMLMKNEYNLKKKVKVTVRKNLPLGSGLGGGSSNAATCLKALNKMWNMNLTKNELICLAQKIGSDVPFFIENVPSIIEGVGEKISVLPSKFELYFLLVIPSFQIATKKAFEMFDSKEKNSKDIDIVIDAYLEKDFKKLEENIFNDLDFKDPRIEKIKKSLLESGATNAFLTGSGSTIYSIFESEEEAIKVKMKYLENKNDKIVICRGL